MSEHHVHGLACDKKLTMPLWPCRSFAFIDLHVLFEYGFFWGQIIGSFHQPFQEMSKPSWMARENLNLISLISFNSFINHIRLHVVCLVTALTLRYTAAAVLVICCRPHRQLTPPHTSDRSWESGGRGRWWAMAPMAMAVGYMVRRNRTASQQMMTL